MNKKTVAVLLLFSLFAALTGGMLCGCTRQSETDGKLSVVATVFPLYDWTKEIVGDAENVTTTLLLDKGVDLHSYQPTAEDLIKVAGCDLFIYVGGESDAWVADALKNAANPQRRVLCLSSLSEDLFKPEETVEGMEAEEEHGHDHEEEGGEGAEEVEYDEHVWLSLRNASVFCRAIGEMLASMDGANADKYTKNTAAYTEKLEELDAAYREATEHASRRTLLFADRFPFRYLCDDYGLSYYAAFSGCSAESEAGFETVAFLSSKLDELDLPAVLILEGSDGKIASTVLASSKKKQATVLSMDSLQSVTGKEAADGASYLSLMEKNLDVLKQALN